MSQEPVPNRVCARLALTTSFYRPVLQASRIECPVLLQVCQHDSVAPPAAVARTAVRLGPKAQLKHYPIGHFDIYQGEAFTRAVRDQLEFLKLLLK
jgi:pimeloyl-ACP methyl ester carboxylesterase